MDLAVEKRVSVAVEMVSCYGVSDGSHVYTYLMCPARFEAKFDEGIARACFKPAKHFVIGNGIIASFFDGKYPAFDFVRVGPADRFVDNAFIFCYYAVDNGQISFLHLIPLHLAYETLLNEAVLGDYQQAGGVHIKSVGEAYLVLSAVLQHFLHDTVGDGVVRLALGRVNHIAGLFVNDQKMFVLKDCFNRYIFRRKITGFLWKSYGQLVAWLKLHPASDRESVHRHEIAFFELGQ